MVRILTDELTFANISSIRSYLDCCDIFTIKAEFYNSAPKIAQDMYSYICTKFHINKPIYYSENSVTLLLRFWPYFKMIECKNSSGDIIFKRDGDSSCVEFYSREIFLKLFNLNDWQSASFSYDNKSILFNSDYLDYNSILCILTVLYIEKKATHCLIDLRLGFKEWLSKEIEWFKAFVIDRFKNKITYNEHLNQNCLTIELNNDALILIACFFDCIFGFEILSDKGVFLTKYDFNNGCILLK